MRPLHTRAIPAILVALLASSCASFQFEHQEIQLRHDAEGDALDVLLIYEALHAHGEKADELQVGLDALEGIVRGHRHFIVLDWPWEADLDDLDPEEMEGELEERFLAYVPRVSLQQKGFFRDDEGRLGLYQHLRFESVSELVELANEALNESLREEAEDGIVGEELGWLDDPTRRLWAEHAKEGRAWFGLRGGALEISGPLSPAAAAKILSGMLAQSAKAAEDPGASELLVQLFRPMTALHLEDQRAILRYDPDEDGLIVFRFARPGWEHEPRLQDALLESRPSLVQDVRIEEIRRLLRSD